MGTLDVFSTLNMQRLKSDVRLHDHSCIMGNQGKRAGNSKICIGIQSQLILPEFIYLMLSP